MNRDSIDDTGKPFEPETPDEFFQRGEEAFQIWWSELDPPGSSGGLQLEYETGAGCLVGGLRTQRELHHARLRWGGVSRCAAHETGEMQLACVVHRHHDGKITLPSKDFIDWVAEHEGHIRREYDEGEHDDEDTITVWIDHGGQSPPSTRPASSGLPRIPPKTCERPPIGNLPSGGTG